MSMHDRLPMRFPALGYHFWRGVYLIWGREGRVLHWLELDWGMGIACAVPRWDGGEEGGRRYRMGYVTTHGTLVKCPTETTYLLSTTGKNLPIGNQTRRRQANLHLTYDMIREMSCHYNTVLHQRFEI